MKPQETVVITISRQLGSGGSYLAERLADRLCFKYLDREILQRAAARMMREPEAIEHLEERLNSFWDDLLQSFVPSTLEAYIPPPILFSSNKDLYAVETQIIHQLAQTQNAVILGHGGFHTLASHPGNISIFLHAPKWFRLARVMEIYQKNEKDALAAIEQSDRERRRLVQSLIGVDWDDLRNYHLSLDTSMVRLEAAAEIIVSFVKSSTVFKRCM